MRKSPLLSRSVALLLVAFALASASPRPAAAQGEWTGDFGIPSFDGSTDACAVYHGQYVVAGDFRWAGGTKASNVALWTSGQWIEVGNGLPAAVTRLAVWNGSLLAATNSGSSDSPVMEFDGIAWRAMGANLHGQAEALLVANGTVYAAGLFYLAGASTGYRVVKWNGATWDPVGNELDGHVRALALWNGELYAGGDFLDSDAGYVSRLARWDGAHWVSVGGGVSSATSGSSWVAALAVWQDRLYVGGSFSSAGDVAANGIAAWDGGTWAALPGTPTQDVVADLEPEGGVLHVAGTLGVPNQWDAGLVSFDGQAWRPDTSYPRWSIEDIATGAGVLIAVGNPSELVQGPPGLAVVGIRNVVVRDPAWHGLEAWEPTMRGLRGPSWTSVWALHVHEGSLYAGGYFEEAANPPAWTSTEGIARWDGDRWVAVPGNLHGWVAAMTSWNGLLVAGGPVIYALPAQASVLASDGTGWSPIGGPDGGRIAGWVGALGVWQGALVAGGTLQPGTAATPSAVCINHGSGWQPLGGSLQALPPVNTDVRALASFGGDLYVAGSGLALPGVGWESIARWDGSAWVEVPGLPNKPALSLCTRPDGLWVGLESGFGPIGPEGSVWRWNGEGWTDMGLPGFTVSSLVELDGDVWAVGIGFVAGVTTSVAHLHDGIWTAIPGAPGKLVLTAAPLAHDLFVGGYFTRIGAHAAEALARWSPQAAEPIRVPISLSVGPNPATDQVHFRFTLSRSGHVRLAIHDLGGANVACPVDQDFGPGTSEVTWRVPRGRALRSGVFFVKLETPDGEAKQRLVMVK